MTYEEALTKAAKLLRLSESNNANEAALAASRAQEIIDRFKIEREALLLENTAAPQENIRHFDFDPLDTTADRAGTWKGRLAVILCQFNGCKVYRSGDKLILIGRPSNVSAVRYLYGYLVRETERLARKECAGCGRTFFNNYRVGVVSGIRDGLQTQQEQTYNQARADATQHAASNPMALIRVNQAIECVKKEIETVDAWTKVNTQLNLRTVRASGSARTDYSARAAGYAAGKALQVNAARGAVSNRVGGLLQ